MNSDESGKHSKTVFFIIDKFHKIFHEIRIKYLFHWCIFVIFHGSILEKVLHIHFLDIESFLHIERSHREL